jgi:hypothetical protein
MYLYKGQCQQIFLLQFFIRDISKKYATQG